MYCDLALYIDGKWLTDDGRVGEAVINPATQEAIGHLPHATTDDLDAALDCAARGHETWRAMSPLERSRIMRGAADRIREREDRIARILTLEQGKPLQEARIELQTAIDTIEWYAEEGKRAYGRIIPGRVAGVRQLVMQEPVGPVVALTPWNFPALTPARKIGGALGAGCSIIIKAAEETPGTCVELVRAFVDAGLPPGVINLVFGVPSEVSQHLIASPVVRKVSFTGSVPVGKHLTALSARGMKRTTMELGGHSPVIIFDDVDMDKAADIAVAGKFRNAGQVCISPTRFYVQEGIYHDFVHRFVERARSIVVGDGLAAGTHMGPLANVRRIEAMKSFVGDAEERGGKVATGGRQIGNQGFYFEPTILTDMPDDARVMTEEPFGPIAPVSPFREVDDVLKRANALPFGLAAYAFTNSNARAMDVSDGLDCGLVGVNSLAVSTPETPFGGVKESGHGHEAGLEGLEAFTRRKFVSLARSL